MSECRGDVPIVCNLGVFGEEERARYALVRARVEGAVEAVDEVTGGFALRLSSDAPLAIVAEWISLERRCCPFLDFALEVPSGARRACLRVTGPDGAKEVLRAALRASAR